MASLIERIATRLTRVQSAATPSEAPAPPSPVVIAPQEAEPVTIESLEAALNKLAAARVEQMAIIHGAQGERDRIMDDPDADDRELLVIQDRVALAELSVDRLARLEDEALDQLQPLHLARQRAAWDAARDQFCIYARKYHEAMEELERSANQLWAVRQALFAPVGPRDWEEQVPRLPRLMRHHSGGAVPVDSTVFAQEMERFSRLTIGAPTPVNNRTSRVSAFVQGRMPAEEIEASATFGWTGGVDGIEVLVRLSRDIKPEDSEILRRGTVVRVSALHARELVAAGRAVLSDPAPEWSAGGSVRTLPLPRNSFPP